MTRASAALVIASLVLGAANAGAQSADQAALGELRLDITPFTGGQFGAGASMPSSSYARLGGLIGLGAVVDGPATRTTGRVEVHGRFSADPQLERRYAPYVVAGGMVACASDRRCRPLVVLRVGVEGPPRSGFIPGIELGLGDGIQIGFVIRQSGPRRR